MKKHLNSTILYEGSDLFQNEYNVVKYVGDILATPITESFDCVVALDIFEHADDPYTIFDKMVQITTKYLVINLPNCYDLKSIKKFNWNGQLGDKYKFNPVNQLDRHRWLMNYDEIIRFYEIKAKEFEMQLTVVPMLYGGGKKNMSSRFAQLTKYILPNSLISNSVIGIH